MKKQIIKKLKSKVFVLWLLGVMVKNNLIYPQTTIVTNVDYINDIVTIETFSGNIYQFYGCDDYIINDIVSCIMFTNYTENVTDDIIIMKQYDGYIK